MELAQMDPTWRNTVASGSWHSRHFFLAICFNALNLVSIGRLYFQLHHYPAIDSQLSLFILLMLWLLGYAAWYVHHAYRLAKRAFAARTLDPAAEKAVLSLSYTAFRMYLIGLMFSFITITAANIAAAKLL